MLIGWFAAAERAELPVFSTGISCLEDRENTTMAVWEELTLGFLDAKQLLRVFTRLLAAILLGAAIGFQRERQVNRRIAHPYIGKPRPPS